MLKARSHEIASSIIDGEATLIHLTTRVYYALDGVGAEIWFALQSGTSRDRLIEELAPRYAISPAVLAADLDRLLAAMQAEALIEELEGDLPTAEPTPGSDVATLRRPSGAAGARPAFADAAANRRPMTRLSAIVPTFNAGRFLGEAIASIRGQSRPPDEIIIVDDGSTDGTAELARSFGGAVRYLKTDNIGPAATRNHGIRAATGDYVSFLDADDLWLPAKQELQLAARQRRGPLLQRPSARPAHTRLCDHRPHGRAVALRRGRLSRPVALVRRRHRLVPARGSERPSARRP
jgi:hypothetical protein